MQLPAALEADMPLNDADRAWIRETIATALNRRGFAGFIKEWGGVGAAVSVLLFLALQWGGYIEFRTSTNIRLERIEKGLLPLTIQAQITLPTADFQATLPALESAVKTAKKEGIKVSPKVLSDLSTKLDSADSSAPGYWPTAAALITYQSYLVVGNMQKWGDVFKPCIGPADMDSSPDAAVQGVGPDGKPTGPKSKISRVGEHDCYLVLDGKKASGFDCTRCLVRYSGGSLSMRDVNFIDCLFVFEFNSQTTPPPDGQFLSKLILTSQFSHVSVPS